LNLSAFPLKISVWIKIPIAFIYSFQEDTGVVNLFKGRDVLHGIGRINEIEPNGNPNWFEAKAV
jgi:hypothetical protein